MLKGMALTARARELNIPGRSRMSADELRAAIAAVTAPAPAQKILSTPFADMVAGMPPVWDAATMFTCDPYGRGSDAPAPFRTRNGKHKPSRTRRTRRTRRNR